MSIVFLIKGILLGIAIAAPVGPVGVLCIRRTLRYGRFSGFCSGLGAAVADTVFGVIAAYGLTFVSDFLVARKIWIHLIGSIFLITLGLRTFFSTKVKIQTTPMIHKNLLADFVSAFFLTLTNPLTVFGFLAIFAGMGLGKTGAHEYMDAFWLVCGIFIGSCIWWLILSEGITFFRERISEKIMLWVNRCAGTLIIAFGIFVFLGMWFGY